MPEQLHHVHVLNVGTMPPPVYDISSSPTIDPIRLPTKTQANARFNAASSNGSGSHSVMKSVPLIEIDDMDDDIISLSDSPQMVCG